MHRHSGVLIRDDSTPDKPYAYEIQPVGWHRSGKHRGAVRRINLIGFVRSDGDRLVPCDYGLYKVRDGRTQNDHFRALLATAAERGFRPRCALFGMWYAGLEDLEAVCHRGWTRLTQLKANRLVNPDGSGLRPVSGVALTPRGTIVHLQSCGRIKAFGIGAQDGGIEYWATNDLEVDELARSSHVERIRAVEDCHRGLKQCCGAERAQARGRRAITSGCRSGRCCG